MSDGRWPANVILSHAMADALDEQSGTLKSGALKPYKENHESVSSYGFERDKTYTSEANEGGASRFFLNAGYEPWELEWILANGLRPCGD